MRGHKWVRLDCGIQHHDKFLELLEAPRGLEAAAVYMFGLAWCGQAETDGFIPQPAVRALHAAPEHIQALVSVHLWDPTPEGSPRPGWIVRNWDKRQVLSTDDEASLLQRRRLASRKANCVRHHGDLCGCWAREPK